ncbi:MAG: hypothetical protein QME12_02130 [Nanoarchaeota archaeon]|nr:hypothetical protein [Nanoarchaeota archaeon]
MSKEERLDRKVFRLFKAAGHPRWFHHFGPKKFQTWIFCLGIILKQIYQLSYRRAVRFLKKFKAKIWLCDVIIDKNKLETPQGMTP